MTGAALHLGELRPDGKNARKHTPRNIGMIASALGEVGAARSIVIDEHNVVLAGNGVVEAAAQAGITKVQVIDADGETLVAVRRCGLSEKQKQRLALFDNRAGELAEWNADVLLALRASDAALLEGLFVRDELDRALRDLTRTEGRSDADDVPAGGPRRAVRGDVWRCGDHVVVCGDCRDPAVVRRALGGVLADLVVTDPPYCVDYAGKNSMLNTMDRGNCIQTPMTSDGGRDEVKALWPAAFATMCGATKPGGVYYMTGPQGGDLAVMMMMMMMKEAGWLLKHQLIWVKDSHVLGRCDYHYRHEPILYGWKPGAAHYCAAPPGSTSVWEIPRPRVSKEHPTAKPVELFTRCVEHGTRPGEMVLDPFAGSGTTMIAAQQTGRRCAAVEIEPHYVDVILARWEAFTGGAAVKEASAHAVAP